MDLVSYADLVVELVNTQHPAEDSLKDLETLRDLLTIRPHLTGRLTSRDLDGFRQLRANFRAIFEAAAAGDHALAADGLNNLLILYPIHPALSNHGDSPWHLHLTEDGTITDRYAAGAAMGLALVIGERGFGALGICACPGCFNIYFHKESDSSQRYCSEGCSERDSGQ
ncbi:ABATE domain-containing protein [Actinocorallia longicatena]|uniref:CGNR zinc finger domain-containing protein n=1 Tax=Actinocorallia longicatena TaxID=111803 RepID=A0ABP6Q398_9ACTN